MEKTGIKYRFTKRDKEVLTRLLERMYTIELKNYDFFNNYPTDAKKTHVSIVDRRFRLELKATQVLLFKLKSPLLLEKNGKQRPNFRKTLSIDAR